MRKGPSSLPKSTGVEMVSVLSIAFFILFYYFFSIVYFYSFLFIFSNFPNRSWETTTLVSRRCRRFDRSRTVTVRVLPVDVSAVDLDTFACTLKTANEKYLRKKRKAVISEFRRTNNKAKP
jgi:hypothetical protein